MPKGLKKGSQLTLTPAKLAANRKNAQKRVKEGSLLRQLYAHYIQSAERREMDFVLTVGEFQRLVESDCYYCGAKPARLYRPSRYTSSYVTNGVDRADNTLGYTPENCVPCCKTCNQFKSTLTKEQMLEVVKRIYDLHIAKEF